MNKQLQQQVLTLRSQLSAREDDSRRAQADEINDMLAKKLQQT